MPDLDTLCVDTIRTLAMDAVQQANSGHPGAPMSLAPVAYELFQNHMRYDPAAPNWPGRDRFVMSNGHASMLVYSVLHLIGAKGDDRRPVTLDEIKRFRQLGSCTPGHPESHLTTGVETTTGPLGQGIANAVGMAIAARWIQATYSRPGFESLFGNRVFAICGDGCMMEGIASEAASLAGHLKLANLCLMYDDNQITIDGATSLAFTEDVGRRFEAYGWRVRRVADANDRAAVGLALEAFEDVADLPTLIIVKSKIAWGAPKKQGTKEAHGEPLGDEEIKATKKVYGWPEDAKFLVPASVYEHFQKGIGTRGAGLHAEWDKKFAEYKKQYPDLASQIETMEKRDLPAGWDKDIPTFPADPKGIATRESSGKVINAVGKNYPWLVGGAADLNPSTKTKLTFDGAGVQQAESPGGRNIHFGVREHAMGAVMNGMALSKLRAYGSGFMIFSDYGRGALRLASVMELPVIYIFTHDSIGVGEDGPTHQPIEHLASMRAMPGMTVIRPGDSNEVSEAWRTIGPWKHQPVVLSLTRQALPTLDRTKYAPASGLAKGGYTLAESSPTPDVILIGTGSELSLAVDAYEKLKAEGVKARVVSLPCWELFEKQTQSYRDSVLPPKVTKRVTVEMGSTFGWERYATTDGIMIGMTTFGASAPLKDLLKHFGFTVDAVYQAAKKLLA